MIVRRRASGSTPTSDAAIREHVRLLLASRRFERAGQLRALLAFLVEETLAGRGDTLKEYVIGTQGLGRHEAFDPEHDPIVRVQVRHLRARLEAYYAEEGRRTSIRVSVPKGAYVAVFATVDAACTDDAAAARGGVTSTRPWRMLVGDDAHAAATCGTIPGSATPAGTIPGGTTRLRTGDATLGATRRSRWRTAALAVALGTAMLAVVALRDVTRPTPILRDAPPRSMTTTTATTTAPTNTATTATTATSAAPATTAAATAMTRAGRGAERDVADDARISPESRDLYARGRVLWNRRTADALALAIGLFEQAIARDPGYADAHAALAATYAVMEFNGVTPPGQSVPKARLAATRALALDPRSALALAVLAGVASSADRDWTRSNALFEQAATIEPADATVLHWYGTNLIVLGRFDDAIRVLRRARTLDPQSMPIAYSIGEAHLYARRPDRTIDVADAMLRDDPTYAGAHDLLSRAYTAQRRWDRALREAERCTWSAAQSAIVLAGAGRRDEARALAEALERTDLPARAPYAIAAVHAQLGDREAAFRWLQLASRLGQADLVTLNVDPWFDPVRDDARFAALVRTLGLTPLALPLSY